MKAKLGMSPIAWWNDDLPELSDDVSLEECLRQSRSAGFTGMEQGRRFPSNPQEMLPILKAADVTLCGGWFSGTLTTEGLAENKDRIQPMIELFKAVDAPCIVYGEVGRSIQGDRARPLAGKAVLSDDEMKAYARKVTEFGEWCAEQGMPLAYHHHMAAVVQFEHELDAFMNQSGEGIPLLLDAGHLAFAGGDVLAAINNHHKRISHVHVKDIRRPVVDSLDWNKQSFLDAVALGAFTVPGDGSLDFGAIVQRFADHGYEGWFVVEAEQDPVKSPPLKMAQIGHKELMRVMNAAGYTVETQGFPA
ncbi:myo-inosose-2 dehydratase [Escherichia coli]|nr:myo-inosose-2 dehydratase [Salmonella enterica subsp. enterica serovar Enteritidis]EFG2885479.1 myo-inosose-2 dehydratase [Escherichia coli]EFG8199735.1 myo-inosose-2 dehydratase [Escherichia coli]MIL09171.1 myo-inosose-2 dehydratase [Salmonella enterica subsp. enterica serovar Enteritidis]